MFFGNKALMPADASGSQTAGAQSTAAGATQALGATTIYGPWVDIRNFDSFYVAATITAQSSLNGVMKIQRSMDKLNPFTLPNAALESGTNAQTLTANGSYEWVVPKASYPYVRIAWVGSAGSANAYVQLFGKGAH